ncbi:MAG: sialate O-acetylesterase [Phycisphaerae bacterium]
MLQRIGATLMIAGSLALAHQAVARSHHDVAPVKEPVKVFILTGQSNMVGLGAIGPMSRRGSLMRAVYKDHLYPFLLDSSHHWAVSHRIRYVQVISGRKAGYTKKQWDAYWRTHSLNEKLPKGMMSTWYNQWMTVAKHRFIGPEFGIAHELSKAVHGPILILKSCNGNRSIGWDLLPPGSKNEFYTIHGKTWEYAAYGQSTQMWIKGTPKADRKRVGWYAGKEYDMDTKFVEYVLANLPKYYPGARSYKIAGIFFWQGDKDRYNAGYAAHYEKNLTAYIHAIRKTLHAPKVPFVLATLGQDVKGVTRGNDGSILKAQLAVANPQIHPEFKGNVATVYAHPLSKGGASNGHYNHNSQTYMNVGMAMGKAMVQLLMNK